MSKSFTAAALGILAHDKKLDTNQPLVKVPPSFSQRDVTVQNNATILDFLAHRTGLASADGLWTEDSRDLLIGFKDVLPIVSYFKSVHPFRSQFLYDNFSYDVCATIIEKVSGMDYGSYIAEHILKPL